MRIEEEQVRRREEEQDRGAYRGAGTRVHFDVSSKHEDIVTMQVVHLEAVLVLYCGVSGSFAVITIILSDEKDMKGNQGDDGRLGGEDCSGCVTEGREANPVVEEDECCHVEKCQVDHSSHSTHAPLRDTLKGSRRGIRSVCFLERSC